MSSKMAKDRKPIPYEALLDENHALQDENGTLQDENGTLQEELQSLRARLEEAEELRRAISEGDLDALVIPGPEGKMVFTLDSADRAYRVLVETMNEGTATLAFDDIILYCNHRFAELLRMPLQAIIGKSIYQFIAPENTTTFKALLKQEKGMGEINFRAEGGISLPVYLSINSFQTKGSPNAWCLVVTDLTEQKRNEEILASERLARSIMERAAENIRKKEIHHRIKNNLQVISSLLDLQAEQFEDEKVREAFGESQNRVISMALIHEELYKGEGTDTLNFSAYIRKLAENLFQTYSLSSKNVRLCMDLEENAFFDMDTAVPLGIIVNELVSNSLKHAFPGRDKGEFQIKLRREEGKNEGCKNTNFILTISDNGVGIPENLDIEDPDTLGLQLVTSLVDQLDGKLELKRNNGTEFTMKFTATEK